MNVQEFKYLIFNFAQKHTTTILLYLIDINEVYTRICILTVDSGPFCFVILGTFKKLSSYGQKLIKVIAKVFKTSSDINEVQPMLSHGSPVQNVKKR